MKAPGIKIHLNSAPFFHRRLTQFIKARLHSILSYHRADKASLQERGPAVHQGLLASFIILDKGRK